MAQEHQETLKQIIRLCRHLPRNKKKQLLILTFMMILASFAEVLSIGAVLPFLGVLTAPDMVFNHNLAQPIIKILEIQSAQAVVLPFTIFFIIAAIFAGLARIALLWIQTQLAMSIGADFSVKVYESTLYQPYILHVSRNSSEILAGARKAEGLVPYIIQPVLLIISSMIILFAVVGALLAINPVISITAFLGFTFIYVTIIKITKRRILDNSRIIAKHQGRVTMALQEGLGGIRDVLIDGTQPVYSKLYTSALIPMQLALASNQVVGAIPRFGVEALGMVLIATLAYVLLMASGGDSGESNAIPVLGALALGAQRLLPVLQQIYYSYITIKGNQASTQDALDLLDQPMPSYANKPLPKPIEFKSNITIKNLGFRYSMEGPWVLRNINLLIPKGSRVGIIGVTGSGKSTVLDVLMGLLNPSEGALFVDNTEITIKNARAWQAHISHVPQSIYLADASIVQNIAFGVSPEKIDMSRVIEAAEQAQIASTIKDWRNGYETMVGERGVRLSGGQRQRIGIARALYRQSSVIIFDEATSALDSETEAAVMQTVESLNREQTILIIAHRLTTIKNCDQIVQVSKNNIKKIGKYEDINK